MWIAIPVSLWANDLALFGSSHITPRRVTQPSASNAHVPDSGVGAAVGSIQLALISALGPGRVRRGRQPFLDTTQAEHAA